MNEIRLAVVGVGAFGQNHLRVIKENPRANLAAVVDTDPAKASSAAQAHNCPAFRNVEELTGQVDAAVVATPTSTHAAIACTLLRNGIDVLIEKPIASDTVSAQQILHAAGTDRIVQVGHLERYNSAVLALRKIVTTPLFFEIHRMSAFSARSLDVDVVLDLMIHDIDLVLEMVGQLPNEIRAAGISILSKKVDIANVRLAFATGCVANITASRVSTERIRKMRLFQPGQYVSIDYTRQDGAVFTVSAGQQIGFQTLAVGSKQEPLKLQLDAFLDCLVTRSKPLVGAEEATHTLGVALDILAKIEEHAAIVSNSLG
ncbi:MAG TPA: Gfo/Idh/MocA family oxidoreductase [Bryobacteraceae bacterium]|nr:Gfo/Idh/MocA family oxidoreductase [Bryobacteraceae bacterium]